VLLISTQPPADILSHYSRYKVKENSNEEMDISLFGYSVALGVGVMYLEVSNDGDNNLQDRSNTFAYYNSIQAFPDCWRTIVSSAYIRIFGTAYHRERSADFHSRCKTNIRYQRPGSPGQC
jgi:hypothetical protein